MKVIKIKIKYLVEIPLKLTIEEIRKYPTNSSYLYQQKQETLTYKYSPCKGLDEKGYINFLKQHFIKLYNPLSIEILG